jgi:hypothetical protein
MKVDGTRATAATGPQAEAMKNVYFLMIMLKAYFL